jgi:hypothetical protein
LLTFVDDDGFLLRVFTMLLLVDVSVEREREKGKNGQRCRRRGAT